MISAYKYRKARTEIRKLNAELATKEARVRQLENHISVEWKKSDGSPTAEGLRGQYIVTHDIRRIPSEHPTKESPAS